MDINNNIQIWMCSSSSSLAIIDDFFIWSKIFIHWKKIISAICVHHPHHQWRQYEKKKLQRSFCQSIDDFQFFFVDWMVVYDRHEFVSNSKIQRPCYYHHHHYLFINKGGELNLYFFLWKTLTNFFIFILYFVLMIEIRWWWNTINMGKREKKLFLQSWIFFVSKSISFWISKKIQHSSPSCVYVGR